mmetsp:Transcript_7298/g.3970  ORF Transcript_7298/g.3970 Transcript_7298/m.3970 type:complete len:112 (+) Transcript_7298:115-450(+)
MNIEVGVCLASFTEYSKSFSYRNTGWAFYNQLAELYHNSRSILKYGKRLKEGSVLVCYMDTRKRTLAFSGNGEDWGVACTLPDCGVQLYFAVTMSCKASSVELLSVQCYSV